MQALIKRYFWVLGAITVMVCSVFAAKATSHVVEAKFLGDPDHAPKVAVVAPSPATPVKQVRSKDGQPLASRNMFCSECTPAAITVSSDPSSVQNTSLPLQLLATTIGVAEVDSFATVVNTENQRQGAFSVGDLIPGATGKLVAIRFQYIDFENNGHLERLTLLGVAPPPVVAAAPVAAADGDKDDMQAAVDNGVKKIDDTHYEIDRSLVDKVLANPMGVAKGARVVPAIKDGKPDGFKLYSIRPNSVFAKLGLTNGDTLQGINGMELTSADKALEIYTKLREATTLQVDVQRRGKPLTLNYGIR
jgi:general secretion pathway protein C